MLASSIMFLALATTIQVEKAPVKVDPSLLVGTWEVVKSEQTPVGSIVEFGGGGKFVSMPKGNGSGYEGTYTVKDDQVTVDPAGLTITVKELTRTRLVLDGFNGVIEYRRKGANATGMPRAVQKSGGFTFGVQPKASGRWAVVKFVEDGFTVEMPGQPNGHESENGGGFEMRSMTHQTRGLDFTASAIIGPTEVPDEARAKAFESIRDKFVGKYGKDIKVVSEKTVQAGPLTGQEFEVTLDRLGAGPARARGRVFLQGKTAFVLLVMPVVKMTELPPDAAKFLESFALIGASKGSSAKANPPMAKAKAEAPRVATPKVERNSLKEWGTEVDPDGDVDLKATARGLTMTIPASAHVLAPERDKMNAPRVVSPTRGDFVATVKVVGPFDPSDKSTVKGLSSRQAGGLIVWKDSKNYLVFQRRATSGDEGKESHGVVVEELVDGHKGVTHRQAIPDGTVALRLERKGGRVMAEYSTDGKSWKDLKPVETTWAEGEVEVGVVAVNTSTRPHAVSFEGYSLKVK